MHTEYAVCVELFEGSVERTLNGRIVDAIRRLITDADVIIMQALIHHATIHELLHTDSI